MAGIDLSLTKRILCPLSGHYISSVLTTQMNRRIEMPIQELFGSN
ncbi:hypothetical protein [Alkalibacterium kapii]|nr:hypothetical protein [Alkalibacterium kapii]